MVQPSDDQRSEHHHFEHHPTDDALAALLRDEHRRDALGQRRRRRTQEEVGAASGSLVGVLMDLAEQGATVTVSLDAGTRHKGVLTRVGSDIAQLRAAEGAQWLAVDHMASMRVEPGSGTPIGDRPRPGAGSLATLLADLASRREPVAVLLADGTTVGGRLCTSGTDVVAVRAGAAHVYVAMGAIAAVTIRSSP